MSGVPFKWYDIPGAIQRLSGKAPQRITSKRQLPSGKVVDLGFYLVVDYQVDTTDHANLDKRWLIAPEIERPVIVEHYQQLMFLYVNGRYIDVFTKWDVSPSRGKQFQLSGEQRTRVLSALAS